MQLPVYLPSIKLLSRHSKQTRFSFLSILIRTWSLHLVLHCLPNDINFILMLMKSAFM